MNPRSTFQAPFVEVPDGISIAHWFAEESPKPMGNHGCDGIDLYRGDDTSYCYLWVTSKVDLDLHCYWLLDIRTAGAESFSETRDFLLVAHGVGIWPLECEWFNHPIDFKAPAEAHQEHLAKGLEWFHGRVMGYVEGLWS